MGDCGTFFVLRNPRIRDMMTPFLRPSSTISESLASLKALELVQPIVKSVEVLQEEESDNDELHARLGRDARRWDGI